MHKILPVQTVLFSAIIMAISFVMLWHFTITQAATNGLFLTDLNGDEKYYNDITALIDHHIISGYPDGTFRPTQEVNRAEALKMIMIGAELIDPQSPTPDSDVSALTFTDIDNSAWYGPYIALGIEKGIVQGYPDGTFHPEAPVNMAETMKIMVNTFKLTNQNAPTEDPFSDITKDAWYAPYAETLKTNFILYGDADGLIKPAHNVTREEFAHWLYRTMEKETIATKIETGRATYYSDIFEGDHTANGEVFTQKGFTAAHRTLAFGTIIRVMNTVTKETVEVTVNDRGPYDDRFILDLSSGAFAEIGSLSSGILNIQIEIISE